MNAQEQEKALSALHHLSPDMPEQDWWRIAAALRSESESLFKAFDEWSRGGEKYDVRKCRDAWKNHPPKPGGVAIGTLYGMAIREGWKAPKTPKVGATPKTRPPAPIEAPKPINPVYNLLNIWERSTPATAQHAYCQTKGVSAGAGLHNLRVLPENDPLRIAGHSMAGALLVPVRSAEGALLSVQCIPPVGPKMNIPGAVLGDGFHVVGELVTGQPAYVVEGIGAAWAIWGDTGCASVVTFSAGRMGTVAKAVSQYHPDVPLVLVPDVGQEAKAQTVAAELGCALVTLPTTEAWADNSDAWDYAEQHGPSSLADLLESAVVPAANTVEATDRLPLEIVFADQLGDTYNPPDELVQGLLTVGDGSMLYGDSNSGKTFFAIDLACAVARGVEWHGRRVEQGLVMYVASESPGSVRGRLQAYQQHHRCKVPHFAIVQSPLDLFSDDVDTQSLIDAAKHLERIAGQPVRLIVGDTLARLSAGANENSGQDMGLVVQRFDRIRRETGAHFLMIHHSGKAAAAGARGWSGIRAAVDTEIEVTDAPTGRCAEATKQRDLSTKGERIGFTLERVTLGQTKWGEEATSCVVVPTDAPEKVSKGKRMGEVEGAVIEFLAHHKVGIKKADVVKHFAGRYEKGPIYRAMKSLMEAQAILEACGMVAIAAAAK